MYLSQLQLEPRSRTARRWLADCHELHRGIMAAFPHVEMDAARAALGVLFRVDYARDGRATVLVQSKALPDWTALPALVASSIAGPKEIAGAFAAVAAGDELRFRLRANPTRRVSKWAAAPDSNRERREDASAVGKRVDLRSEAEQVAWLERRGATSDGFELLRVRAFPGNAGETVAAARADPAGRLEGVREDSRGDRRKLTFGTVVFEGLLRVTDPGRFRAALESGIGPGKAFGCGLLSLAPR